MKSYLVSIIVPVFNAQTTIERLVEALFSQTYEPIELIFVDNNSTDSTRHRLAQYGDRVKIIKEFEQSSYAARNAGINAARGDFLAFTDSDCLPTVRWVENLVAGLQTSDVVGGHVVFDYTDTPSTAEIYDSLVHMQIGETISRYGVAATANLAVRKEVFSIVGDFPTLKSSGDFVWTRKLRDKGLSIEFVSDAIVHHSARNREELLVKAERLGRGFTVRGSV